MKRSTASFRATLALALSCLVIAAFACCAGQHAPAETARIQGRHFTLHLVPGPESLPAWFHLQEKRGATISYDEGAAK